VAASALPAAAAGGGGLLSTAATVAPYLSVASAGIGALSNIASGNAQSAALQAQASTDQINAGTALTTAAASMQRNQIRAEQTVATTANTYGGDGINSGTGSPLNVMASQAAQGALDSEIIRWQGGQQASADLNAATQANYAASQASTAGLVNAGTTLLTAGARYATSQLPVQTIRAGGNQAIV
jgi:hypothetical protein